MADEFSPVNFVGEDGSFDVDGYLRESGNYFQSEQERLLSDGIVNDDGTINWDALDAQARRLTGYTFGDWISGRYSSNLQGNRTTLLNNALSMYADSTKAQRTAKDYAAAGFNPLYSLLGGSPSSSFSPSSGSGSAGNGAGGGFLRSLFMLLMFLAKAAV